MSEKGKKASHRKKKKENLKVLSNSNVSGHIKFGKYSYRELGDGNIEWRESFYLSLP